MNEPSKIFGFYLILQILLNPFFVPNEGLRVNI